MLASDLNNPEFAGATNPDGLLSVEFYDYKAKNPLMSFEKGIDVFEKECPYIRIAVPGRTDLTVERPADGKDVQRFPSQWMRFQMQKGAVSDQSHIPGWKLEEWADLSDEQVRLLKHLRFYTVEQIAGANDIQVQAIGIGGEGLRKRAREALQARNAAQVSGEVSKRDEKIAELEATVAKLMEMMTAPEEAKRGRPRKEETV